MVIMMAPKIRISKGKVSKSFKVNKQQCNEEEICPVFEWYLDQLGTISINKTKPQLSNDWMNEDLTSKCEETRGIYIIEDAPFFYPFLPRQTNVLLIFMFDKR